MDTDPLLVGLGKWICPAGTYSGIDKDRETMANTIPIACYAGLPDDVVYQLMRGIMQDDGFAHMGEVYKSWKGYNWNEHLADKVIIPFHPGAIRYIKEQGVTIGEPLYK